MSKNPERSAIRKDNFMDAMAIAGIVGILSVGSIISFVQIIAFLGMISGQ